jgi:hypothetical protein
MTTWAISNVEPSASSTHRRLVLAAVAHGGAYRQLPQLSIGIVLVVLASVLIPGEVARESALHRVIDRGLVPSG